MDISTSKEFIRSVLMAHKALIGDAWVKWQALDDKARDAYSDGFKDFLIQFIDSFIAE